MQKLICLKGNLNWNGWLKPGFASVKQELTAATFIHVSDISGTTYRTRSYLIHIRQGHSNLFKVWTLYVKSFLKCCSVQYACIIYCTMKLIHLFNFHYILFSPPFLNKSQILPVIIFQSTYSYIATVTTAVPCVYQMQCATACIVCISDKMSCCCCCAACHLCLSTSLSWSSPLTASWQLPNPSYRNCDKNCNMEHNL